MAARDIVEKLLYVIPKQATTPARSIMKIFSVTVRFNDDTSSLEFGDIELFIDDLFGFTREFHERDIRGDDDLFTIVKRYFNPITSGRYMEKTERALRPDFKEIYQVTYWEYVEGKIGDRIPPRLIVKRDFDIIDVFSAYTGKTAEAFIKEFAAPVKTEMGFIYSFIIEIIVKENEYLLITRKDDLYSNPICAIRERDMNRDLMKKFFNFDDFA